MFQQRKLREMTVRARAVTALSAACFSLWVCVFWCSSVLSFMRVKDSGARPSPSPGRLNKTALPGGAFWQPTPGAFVRNLGRLGTGKLN